VSDAPRSGPPGSRVVFALVAVIALSAAGYFIVAMPGMDMGGNDATASMPPMSSVSPPLRQVSATTFERLVADPASVVINVHTPYEGEIVGTDAVVAYDAIIGSAALPVDKSTPLLLYCKTGRMSAEAASALGAAGYTNIVLLVGGTDAWQASGRPITVVAR
jgi:rhodanese-related sulfurtransferase